MVIGSSMGIYEQRKVTCSLQCQAVLGNQIFPKAEPILFFKPGFPLCMALHQPAKKKNTGRPSSFCFWQFGLFFLIWNFQPIGSNLFSYAHQLRSILPGLTFRNKHKWGSMRLYIPFEKTIPAGQLVQQTQPKRSKC